MLIPFVLTGCENKTEEEIEVTDEFLISDSDDNKDNLNKEIVYLKNYIKSIAYNYEGKALEKNIVIKYQLENIEALIDKEKFAQVIINILSNAIKFTDNNGNISVFIEADEKYVFILV